MLLTVEMDRIARRSITISTRQLSPVSAIQAPRSQATGVLTLRSMLMSLPGRIFPMLGNESNDRTILGN